MEVKSFDFREKNKKINKNVERCVGRIWHVKKKKKELHGVFVKFQ